MLLNNLFVFLNNACGNADCISSHEGHLCEDCYNISKFCDDCRVHLTNVLDLSDFRFFVFLLFALVLGFVGFLFGRSKIFK